MVLRTLRMAWHKPEACLLVRGLAGPANRRKSEGMSLMKMLGGTVRSRFFADKAAGAVGKVLAAAVTALSLSSVYQVEGASWVTNASMATARYANTATLLPS